MGLAPYDELRFKRQGVASTDWEGVSLPHPRSKSKSRFTLCMRNLPFFCLVSANKSGWSNSVFDYAGRTRAGSQITGSSGMPGVVCKRYVGQGDHQPWPCGGTRPVDIECQTVGGVGWREAAQKIRIMDGCSVDRGFTCLNSDNERAPMNPQGINGAYACDDYRVRYLCAPTAAVPPQELRP